MKQTAAIKIIVEICRDFPTKFGIPRQSGLVLERETLRDIEGYSHLWLLWDFSETWRESWRPTVRLHPKWGTVLRVTGAGLMDGTLIYVKLQGKKPANPPEYYKNSPHSFEWGLLVAEGGFEPPTSGL